jgi:hypothetical protein
LHPCQKIKEHGIDGGADSKGKNPPEFGLGVVLVVVLVLGSVRVRTHRVDARPAGDFCRAHRHAN